MNGELAETIALGAHACSRPERGIDFAVVRYGQHGRRDRTFGNDGIVRTDFRGAEFANASALRFGKLVVAGSGGRGTDYDFALARYRLD